MPHPSIKVLCLGRFCDETPGGTQTHVESLFSAIEPERVRFINLVPARRLKSDTTVCNGVTTHRVAAFKLESSVYASPLMIFKAMWLNRKHKFDVVHLHFPDPMSHLASIFLPGSIARVITWHSDIVRQQNLLKFYRPWLHASLRSAKAIIVATPQHVSSSPTLAALEDQLPIHVVPFGFDYSKLIKPPSALATKDQDTFVVFALGRHVYYKGFEYLIRAIAKLPENFRLVLGGDGPLTGALKSLALELGALSRIEFTGYIAQDQLAGRYHACDVFCLPAVERTEAFGIVQLEAMACAKPVISTRLGNGVDFLNREGKSGLIAEPKDVDSLIQCLLKLEQNPPLRKAMGLYGQKMAQEEYSITKMGQTTYDLYKAVTGK